MTSPPRHLLSFLALLSFATSPLLADVRLPALFTDHMVLQQGQKNRVWGSADAKPGPRAKVPERQIHAVRCGSKAI